MSNELFIEQKPGDLITAENWNELQRKIKAEIQSQVAKAKSEIKQEGVDKAGNADKLENKTKAQLTDEILKLAEALSVKRTGYRTYFRWISAKDKQEVVIEHKLQNYPVVDVYELEPIDVICSEDDEFSKAKVLFYLHHTSEMNLSKKVPDPSDPNKLKLEKMILDSNYDIPFSVMLEHYGITPDDDSTLDSLEDSFWSAFFAQNGENFDQRADEQTCHSPWFDRCCGDKRTVSYLIKAGEWDKLMFQVRPRKTVNLEKLGRPTLRPANVQVSQFGFNKIEIKLASEITGPAGNGASVSEIPVLIILKV